MNLIVSTDGGTTWSTPVTLPGENKTQGYTAMSPSVSVSATGELAVSYVTNRSCIANCTAGTIGPYSNFGDDVVVATSTTNGSSTGWTLNTVYHATGEPVEILYACYVGGFGVGGCPSELKGSWVLR